MVAAGDPDLRANPTLPAPRVTLTGVYTQEFVHTRRLPEVHDALRRVRSFVERRAPGAVLADGCRLPALKADRSWPRVVAT
jgi:hypothetical protein